jgi:hypothetical protein
MLAPIATSDQTIAALLVKSKTRRAALRRIFVQQGTQREPVPGPLAGFVTGRDMRALDLLCLLHAVTTGAPYAAEYGNHVWARALGLSGAAGRTAISRAWASLEERQLITRSRPKRFARVTVLMEDGSGRPYAPVGLQIPAPLEDVYFQIPLAYWYEGWHVRLSLAAKAMLLISLSLRDGFTLPAEKAHTWYGISGDTAKKGIDELRENGLLFHRIDVRTAPLLPAGVATFRRYTLRAPFRRARPVHAAEPTALKAVV